MNVPTCRDSAGQTGLSPIPRGGLWKKCVIRDTIRSHVEELVAEENVGR